MNSAQSRIVCLSPVDGGEDEEHTGQRQAEAGRYFYNARWYDPEIGRFIQADAIIPSPGNPLAWDRYAYANNNPLYYTDKSGHKSCEYYDGEDHCINDRTPNQNEYDLTDFLAHELSDSGSTVESLNSVYDSGLSGVYGYMFGTYWRYGPKNIKVEIKNKVAEGIILCGESSCRWVDYSAAGNILFGYSAEAAQIPSLFSSIIGGAEHIAETALDPDEQVNWGNCTSSYCDDPGDYAAVAFGSGLYSTYGTNITITEFQQALTTDVLNSFEPPPSNFIIPFAAYHGSNDYKVGYFDN